MTEDEKRELKLERNRMICAYYAQGHKLRQCATHFRLGRQRILQILQQEGAWVPYVKMGRNKFLGVNVTERTKRKLKEKADEQGISVSRLASDTLDEMVR